MAKPTLVDHLGRPIDFTRLKRQVAGPTVAGVRSVISGATSSGLDPVRLAGILRRAEQGDAVAYYELAEQMEEKDLHYLGVLGQRKRGVAQLEVTVEAAGDDKESQADADLLRTWLKRDTLDAEFFDILDAVGKAESLTEMVWATSESQWWPESLEWVDLRFTERDRIDGRTILLKGDDGVPTPLDPFKYIQCEIRAKSGLAVRSGLARPVSWAWMFKNYGIKDWVAFAEVYGLPLRIGKYGNNATEEDKAILLRAVADIGSDAAAIIPESMKIEFQGGTSQAGDGALFEKQAMYFDMQISKAVLGQTATTDAVIGGLGSGKEHGEVREDIERADAKSLQAALNRDLVRPFIDLNRGPPGLRGYPRLVIGRAESWDAGKMMPVVKAFVELGGRVGMSEIRDRIGISDPSPDEAVLVMAPSAAPPPPADPKAAPPAPGSPPAAPTGRKNPPDASQALLKALSDALQAASLQQDAVQPDALDDLTDLALDGWEQVVGAIVDPIGEVLDGANSLEEVRDRLTTALAQMDAAPLTEALARAGFNARLAGLTGLPVSDAEA